MELEVLPMRFLPVLLVPSVLAFAACGAAAQTSTVASTVQKPAATSTAATASKAPGARAAAAEIDYFTWLNASRQFAGARGNSEYDVQGGRREADVEVSGVSRLAGKRVTVYISGKKIGTMTVSRRGRAEREWSNARGQFVPVAGAGSQVRVRTANGALIASGRYHREID
jgi:hypothetical protein